MSEIEKVDALKASITSATAERQAAIARGDKVAANRLRGQISYDRAKLIELAKKMAGRSAKSRVRVS